MAMQKTFPLFQLISQFFSHLFMNINIPSEDDGVLTAASDDRIEATFSFHFWAFSLQAIFVQQKLFLFLLLDFFLTQPHC